MLSVGEHACMHGAMAVLWSVQLPALLAASLAEGANIEMGVARIRDADNEQSNTFSLV